MENKVKYVLSLFKKIYGLHDSECQINYGIDHASKVQIKRGRIDFFGQKAGLDLSRIIWKEWQGVKLPFLLDNEDAEVVTIEDGRAVINFDLIASSFYFLSGWQEYTCEKKDRYGRFPYAESLQSKLNLVELPLVNYYFDILKTTIERVYKRRLTVQLWQDFDFAVCLTHDIDKCQSGWREGGGSELRRGRLASALRLLLRKARGRDVWFNFDEILAIEKQYGARSSFYFLCRDSRNDGPPNADYDIGDERFSHVYRDILAQGSEIGVHGSFGTHDNLQNFKADLRRLNHQAVGNRFHFLEFDINETPRVLQKAGVKYDTTLGFPEHYGFRNGFCFPFYLYDLQHDRALPVVEIPLILMDTTLQSDAYMEMHPQQAMANVEGVLSEVKRFGGCLTLLWHNTHFSDYKFQGWREVFVDLLEYCRNENGFFANGKQIFEIFSGAGSGTGET